MSDDQQSHDSRERRERFEAALDEMFGEADAPSNPESASDLPLQQPQPEVVTASPLDTSGHPPSYPNPKPPPQKRRSIGTTIGIGCAVVIGIVFFCIIALLVIGLVAGEDTPTASRFVPELTSLHG